MSCNPLNSTSRGPPIWSSQVWSAQVWSSTFHMAVFAKLFLCVDVYYRFNQLTFVHIWTYIYMQCNIIISFCLKFLYLSTTFLHWPSFGTMPSFGIMSKFESQHLVILTTSWISSPPVFSKYSKISSQAPFLN